MKCMDLAKFVLNIFQLLEQCAFVSDVNLEEKSANSQATFAELFLCGFCLGNVLCSCFI